MTFEEMVKDYFLERVMEDEDVELSDLIRDKKVDEDWIQQQEKQAVKESLGGPKKLPPDSDFEDVVVEKRE